jgi:hypothetical protein
VRRLTFVIDRTPFGTLRKRRDGIDRPMAGQEDTTRSPEGDLFPLTYDVGDHIRHSGNLNQGEIPMAAKKGGKKAKKSGKKTKTTKKAAKTAKKPAKRKAAKKPAKRAAARKPVKKAAPRPAAKTQVAATKAAPKAAPPAGVPSMLGGAPTSSHGRDDGDE